MSSHAEQAILFESEVTEELREAETMNPPGDKQGFQEKGRVYTKPFRATGQGDGIDKKGLLGMAGFEDTNL